MSESDAGDLQIKIFVMERSVMDRKLERFALLLESGTENGKNMSFEEMCRKAGVSAGEMDRYLYDSFGLSGADILKAYRGHIPLYLL